MAFVASFEEEEKENQAQPGQPQMVASGSQGTITAGGSGGAQSAQGQAAQSSEGGSQSGRWTNLSQIVNANREQAGQFGGQLAGEVKSNIDRAGQGIEQAKQDFSGQVQAQRVDRDDQVLSQLRADPTKVDKDQFVRMRDAQFQGPMSLSDLGSWQGVQSQLGRAQQQTQASQTEEGRGELIRDVFGRPQYTAGQNRLDQLLLQNSPEARQQFQDIQPRFQQVQQTLAERQQAAGSMAQAAAQATQEAREAARRELAAERQELQQGLDQRVAQTRAEQTPLQEQGRNLLSQAQINAQLAGLTGLKGGENIYNLNLADFFVDASPDTINRQTMATADEYAQYAALANLADEQAAMLTDPSLSGQASFARFNRSEFERAQAQQRQAQQAALNAPGQIDRDVVRESEAWLNVPRSLFIDETGTRYLPIEKPLSQVTPKEAVEIMDGYRRAGIANAAASQSVMKTLQNIVDNYNKSFNPSRTVRRI